MINARDSMGASTKSTWLSLGDQGRLSWIRQLCAELGKMSCCGYPGKEREGSKHARQGEYLDQNELVTVTN